MWGAHSAIEMARVVKYVQFWMVCGTYEFVMLAITKRAAKQKRQVPGWLWVVDTIIECLIPSVAMLGQTADKGYLGPYLSLVSGILVLYCMFIILSTLRLNPKLCVL